MLETLWTTLSGPAQALCIGAGGELLAALAHCELTKQQSGQVLAPFYKSWRDGLLKSQDDPYRRTSTSTASCRISTKRRCSSALPTGNA